MVTATDSSNTDEGIVCGVVQLSFSVYALLFMTFFTAILFSRVGKSFLGYGIPRPLNLRKRGPSRAVVFKKLWKPGQVIGYVFIGGTDRQHKKVERGLRTWALYANLEFQRDAANPVLRIAFNQGGPWAYIGKECKDIPANQATMDLSSVDPATPKPSLREQGDILHELGHFLGLLHEHQGPGAEGVLTWNKNALFAYYAQFGWEEEDVLKEVVLRFGKDEVENYSPLDPDSIMTYPFPKNGTHQGIKFKRNYCLSPFDKAADPEWTFHYALNIAGVDASTQLVLLAHYFKGDWKGIRFLFSKWCWENLRPPPSQN